MSIPIDPADELAAEAQEMGMYDFQMPQGKALAHRENMSATQHAQKLIDIMFQAVMMVKDKEDLRSRDNEDLAGWLRANLLSLGYDTRAIGQSYAVLQTKLEDDRRFLLIVSENGSVQFMPTIRS